MKTTYEEAIKNCAIFLRNQDNNIEDNLNAFDLSYGIAVGFGKSTEQVVTDIVDVVI